MARGLSTLLKWVMKERQLLLDVLNVSTSKSTGYLMLGFTCIVHGNAAMNREVVMLQLQGCSFWHGRQANLIVISKCLARETGKNTWILAQCAMLRWMYIYTYINETKHLELQSVCVNYMHLHWLCFIPVNLIILLVSRFFRRACLRFCRYSLGPAGNSMFFEISMCIQDL